MHLSNEIKKTSTYYRTISNNSIQENGCNYLNCKLTGIGTEYMGKLNISRYLRRFMNYFHSIIDPIIYFLINIFYMKLVLTDFVLLGKKILICLVSILKEIHPRLIIFAEILLEILQVY